MTFEEFWKEASDVYCRPEQYELLESIRNLARYTWQAATLAERELSRNPDGDLVSGVDYKE